MGISDAIFFYCHKLRKVNLINAIVCKKVILKEIEGKNTKSALL